MTDSNRGKLTLRESDALIEQEIELDVIDARLPCRNFEITYKVAEVGQVSLTSEFLLRLVWIVDGISEAEAAEFFAFSGAEMAYVVNSLDYHGYLERSEGGLWLTEAGRSLFKAGSEEPQLYEVQRRIERHGFDLISMAPAAFSALSRFDSELPELPPPSAEHVASASRLVPAAFRKHFDALVRRQAQTLLKQSLYTIDDVTAGERFSTLVPISVRARSTLMSVPEPNLSNQWTGYDIDDRSEVVVAAAALLKEIHVPQHFAGADALKVLAEVGKEALSGFVSDGRVRRDAFVRNAMRRAGELRIDRPTVPIVGTLFTDANRQRLRKALEYAHSRAVSSPGMIVWQVPALARWGATRRLPQTLDMIQELVGDGEVESTTIAMAVDRPPRHLVNGFDVVIGSRATNFGLAALELLLVPGHVAAIIVHSAVGHGASYPIPFGIISFDDVVVDRTREVLQGILPFHPESADDRANLNAEELRDVLAKRAASDAEAEGSG